jgi:protein TonB
MKATAARRTTFMAFFVWRMNMSKTNSCYMSTNAEAVSVVLRGRRWQHYGLAASLSIHSIVFIIFLVLSLHKSSDDTKTYYIQLVQMGEQGKRTVQASPPARAAKKSAAAGPERKPISEDAAAIREVPAEEQKAVIKNSAIENPDAVKAPGTPKPAPRTEPTDQGGKSTTGNSSYASLTRISGGGSTASGARGASAGTSGVIETAFGSAGAPVFLKKKMPVYPLAAKKLGKQGRVVLRLSINEKGRLLDVEIVEPAGYGFTESAVDAVRMSSFFPANERGTSVASKALLTIRFVLEKG